MIRPERECLIPSGRDGDDVGQSRSLNGRETVPDDAAMTPLKNGAVRHERNAELVAGGDDRRIRKADDFDGDSFAPVQTPGLSNIIAISAGWDQAFALRSDHTVWGWEIGRAHV